MRALILALPLVLVSTGCMRHEYVVGSGATKTAEPDLKKWNNHFLVGLVGKNEVDVADRCPGGDAFVEEKTTFVNGLVRYVALGGLVYSPTTVSVWCGDSATAKVDTDTDTDEEPAVQ